MDMNINKHKDIKINMGEGMGTRKDYLLLVIKRLIDNGFYEGRLKLMKLVFFLEHFSEVGNVLTKEHLFKGNDFIIYKFGPFSFDVVNDMQELVSEGFIEEEEKGFTKSVTLTEVGEEKINKLQESVDQKDITRIETILNKFGSMNGKQLEKTSLEFLGLSLEDKLLHQGEKVIDLIP